MFYYLQVRLTWKLHEFAYNLTPNRISDLVKVKYHKLLIILIQKFVGSPNSLELSFPDFSLSSTRVRIRLHDFILNILRISLFLKNKKYVSLLNYSNPKKIEHQSNICYLKLTNHHFFEFCNQLQIIGSGN